MGMKKLTLFLVISLTIVGLSAEAKTICSMTFNSTDEREVFKNQLTPIGYQTIELVPQNKDPDWFKKACKQVKSCDILIVSGHFGGLFFGEETSSTLSVSELMAAKVESLCPSILNAPKAVYLMGCNTLASKTPDKRSVSDYLHVLVGDGFPQNLAEEVAAARYLNFGQSMAQNMSTIFNNSEMLVGFDSTGPLGAQSRPKLIQAFKASTSKDKLLTGLSKNALLDAYKETHLKVLNPALDENVKLTPEWNEILTSKNINRYYDFIIKNQNDPELLNLLETDENIKKIVYENMLEIYQTSVGLSHIQIKVLDFLQFSHLINIYEYQDAVKLITFEMLNGQIDYISADQLCSVLKDHRDLNLLSRLNESQKTRLNKSGYANVLYSCANIKKKIVSTTKAFRCLMEKTTYDWACLTENANDLDVDACVLAKSRNSDPENADDMMWFCYSKMRERNYLNRPACLELTHNFSLLGNQIKMNWNCLNRISN